MSSLKQLEDEGRLITCKRPTGAEATVALQSSMTAYTAAHSCSVLSAECPSPERMESTAADAAAGKADCSREGVLQYCLHQLHVGVKALLERLLHLQHRKLSCGSRNLHVPNCIVHAGTGQQVSLIAAAELPQQGPCIPGSAHGEIQV